MLIQSIVFDYEKDPQGYRQKFIRAWDMVNKIDNNTLGQKKYIALDPYLIWVRSRAQNLIMPYPIVLSVIVEPVVEGEIPRTIIHLDIPTDLEELHKS